MIVDNYYKRMKRYSIDIKVMALAAIFIFSIYLIPIRKELEVFSSISSDIVAGAAMQMLMTFVACMYFNRKLLASNMAMLLGSIAYNVAVNDNSSYTSILCVIYLVAVIVTLIRIIRSDKFKQYTTKSYGIGGFIDRLYECDVKPLKTDTFIVVIIACFCITAVVESSASTMMDGFRSLSGNNIFIDTFYTMMPTFVGLFAVCNSRFTNEARMLLFALEIYENMQVYMSRLYKLNVSCETNLYLTIIYNVLIFTTLFYKENYIDKDIDSKKSFKQYKSMISRLK